MSVRFRLILLISAVVHAGLLYLVLTRQLDFLFSDASHRMGPASDFFALYNAGKHWAVGDGVYGHGPGFGFRHHPIMAMSVFAWLSALKPYTAYYVWVALTELTLLVAAILLRKLIADDLHFTVTIAIAVFFSPLYLEIFMGNASALAGCLLLFAYFLYVRSRSTAAFLAFVASCLIKPVGIILLPVIALKGHFKPALLAVVILIGLCVPYFIQHGADLDNLILLDATDHKSTAGFLVHAGNQGLCALLMRIGAALGDTPLASLKSVNQLPQWYAPLVYAWPVLLGGLVLWVTWLHRRSLGIEMMVFLSISAYLLGYKDVWEHSYSILIGALPLVYLSGKIDRRILLAGTLLLALPTGLAFYDVHIDSPGIHDPDWYWNGGTSIVHHATKPLGMLFLFASAMFKLRWNRPSSTGEA
ncbi:MAG: glycosyltransferase family 87 protein [Candidatus Zixiibacteriota bacterium]